MPLSKLFRVIDTEGQAFSEATERKALAITQFFPRHRHHQKYILGWTLTQ